MKTTRLPGTGDLLMKSCTAIERLQEIANNHQPSFQRLCKSIASEADLKELTRYVIDDDGEHKVKHRVLMRKRVEQPLQKAQPAAEAKAPCKPVAKAEQPAWGVPVENRDANRPHLKRQAQMHLDKCLKAMRGHGVDSHTIASIQSFCEHKLDRNEIEPEDLMKHLDECVAGAARGDHDGKHTDGMIQMGRIHRM
ncbi:hypothetical protein IIK97_004084 [Salmonella enterica subsp. enterica serovar Nigeria]|nr:hypothetical protein [Salmonella enterica subsp. enterica serovar Nigeria]